MSYKAFKKRVLKGTDAWVEVLVFDTLALPLTYYTAKFTQHPAMPYVLTIVSFLLRSLGGLMLLTGDFALAAGLIFLSFVTDSMDGKLSRYIFKKDPESRGTLDFILDQVSFCIVAGTLGLLLSRVDLYVFILYLVWLLSCFFFSTLAATKFRLYAAKGINPSTPLRKTKAKKHITKIAKLQETCARYRLIFHPSAIESHVLMFIVFPLYPSGLVVLLALITLWFDIVIAGVAPLYFLLKAK